MGISTPFRDNGWPRGRQWLIAVLAGCLLLAGCASLDALRGDPFPEDSHSQMCEQLRPHDRNNDDSLFLFSNKARQINRHLGAE